MISINMDVQMLLIYLVLMLLWLFSNQTKPHHPSYRKPTADNTGFKYRKKPRWVINRVIEHKAIMKTDGCRKIATSFNRRFGDRETVSKTWVYNIIKKHQYEILMLRKRLKNKKPRHVQINRFWAMDMTGKHDLDKNNLQILGIIDQGSRANLYLSAIKSKASIKLLKVLLDIIEKYG